MVELVQERASNATIDPAWRLDRPDRFPAKHRGHVMWSHPKQALHDARGTILAIRATSCIQQTRVHDAR
ncbi:MAG: hypothetical protein GYA24_04380 [Candidatus Lokiarchaeota archaeon]|nr:hypothetical protein [Candidatus Lokiarchaeota archaeon]